jgi:hypothetical protein
MQRLWKIVRWGGVALGPLLVVADRISLAREVALLGLPSWGWEAIGASIFFMSVISILWKHQHEMETLRDQITRVADRAIKVLGSGVDEGHGPSKTWPGGAGAYTGPPNRSRPPATPDDLKERVIQGKSLSLYDLVLAPPELPIISQRRFVDCNIRGPSAVVLGEGCELVHCSFWGDVRATLIRVVPEQSMLDGIIQLSFCSFQECHFARISIVCNSSEAARLAMALTGKDMD